MFGRIKNILRKIYRYFKYPQYRDIKNEIEYDLLIQIDLLRKKGIKIGNNTAIYSCIFDSNFPFLIEIGNNCIVTGATLLAHDASSIIYTKKLRVGKISIGNNCFIGYNSTIMPGVTIGNNCIIGAGSVVTSNVADNSVFAGNPARFIKTTDEYIKNLESENKYIIEDNFPVIPSQSDINEVIKHIRANITIN